MLAGCLCRDKTAGLPEKGCLVEAIVHVVDWPENHQLVQGGKASSGVEFGGWLKDGETGKRLISICHVQVTTMGQLLRTVEVSSAPRLVPRKKSTRAHEQLSS